MHAVNECINPNVCAAFSWGDETSESEVYRRWWKQDHMDIFEVRPWPHYIHMRGGDM